MSKDHRTECDLIGSHLMNGGICDRCGWTSPAPDDTPTTDPYTGQDMRFGDTTSELREAVKEKMQAYALINQADTDMVANWSTWDDMALDQIVALLAAYYEGLIPEKHGTTSYDYWQGHDDAIDTIRRNFKGDSNG